MYSHVLRDRKKKLFFEHSERRLSEPRLQLLGILRIVILVNLRPPSCLYRGRPVNPLLVGVAEKLRKAIPYGIILDQYANVRLTLTRFASCICLMTSYSRLTILLLTNTQQDRRSSRQSPPRRQRCQGHLLARSMFS
jgi:hypothetical protein